MKVLIAIDIANNICILDTYGINDEQYELVKKFHSKTSVEDVLEFDTKKFGIELKPGQLYIVDVMLVDNWCTYTHECRSYLSVTGATQINFDYNAKKNQS